MGEQSTILRLGRLAIEHWRTIVLLPILALGTYLIIQGNSLALVALALLLIIIASQLFWIARIIDLGELLIPGRPRRASLAVIVGLAYLFVVTYSYIEWAIVHTVHPSDYRLQSILIHAVFWWWFVGSMLAFQLIIAFGILDRAVRAAAWMFRKARKAAAAHVSAHAAELPALDPPSPGRRRFLERTAVLVSATPFIAAGYGLLYERVDVEVVRERARLARLPQAFEGFRIALLSDIHLSPFANAEYIRRCVAITNGLKPDLIALTGDYVASDPEDRFEVVRVLAGLRATHGVFGCLGNHEADTGIENSITSLFANHGIHMLRQQRAPVRIGGESINLIGLDNGRVTLAQMRQQLKAMAMPDTVNILLIHYPFFFGDSDLNIDLTLSGDLHGGGQLSLDSIHRGFNLSRLLGVPYVRGWHRIDGQQLYMNRGIGTTIFPIRLGARPEITQLTLTRT
jgi:predicted MPP superfamily phosphohydrolase